MGSLEGLMGAILGNGGLGSLVADGLLPAFLGSAQTSVDTVLGSVGALVDIGFGSIDSFSAAPVK
ncbi:hypothetical protein RHDE110596_19695 [Prescottella defluvii]|uniref:hypothetical protein n=1 Tax=Prescottella defluvii TaxID=1323361 RepID=UPI0012E011BB|nr:hypothetical protein [Prescottella defluvii]